MTNSIPSWKRVDYRWRFDFSHSVIAQKANGTKFDVINPSKSRYYLVLVPLGLLSFW